MQSGSSARKAKVGVSAPAGKGGADEADYPVWDSILGERMYGGYGLIIILKIAQKRFSGFFGNK